MSKKEISTQLKKIEKEYSDLQQKLDKTNKERATIERRLTMTEKKIEAHLKQIEEVNIKAQVQQANQETC
ncbi:hypothetical protein HN358_04235 [Candidatus Uhrbacteria bacterium]|nr:hypothetical protein [Candidatus Uhrbacteria bacterium]